MDMVKKTWRLKSIVIYSQFNVFSTKKYRNDEVNRSWQFWWLSRNITKKSKYIRSKQVTTLPFQNRFNSFIDRWGVVVIILSQFIGVVLKRFDFLLLQIRKFAFQFWSSTLIPRISCTPKRKDDYQIYRSRTCCLIDFSIFSWVLTSLLAPSGEPPTSSVRMIASRGAIQDSSCSASRLNNCKQVVKINLQHTYDRGNTLFDVILTCNSKHWSNLSFLSVQALKEKQGMTLLDN